MTPQVEGAEEAVANAVALARSAKAPRTSNSPFGS